MVKRHNTEHSSEKEEDQGTTLRNTESQTKAKSPSPLQSPSKIHRADLSNKSSVQLPSSGDLSVIQKDTEPRDKRSESRQRLETAASSSQTSSPSNRQPQTNKPPPPSNMSKLSPSLKQLINAPFSKPSYTIPNPTTLQPVLNNLAASAKQHNISTPAWLTFSTATAMTMNAPLAMTTLWQTAQKHDHTLNPILLAELQREVGLKCISFNGIPRAINCLGAYYNSLPNDIRSKLSTKPTREFNDNNISARKADGLSLWDSVYFGFERKLLSKLAQSHPDLPVHILHGHYASLLSNPSRTTYTEGEEKARETHVGRVLTSLIAIACLRAQTGVGPQVVSHIFGLRKAYERGDASAEGEVEVKGGEWLSGEEGNIWLLGWIDELVRAIGTRQEGDVEMSNRDQQKQKGEGSSFAPGIGDPSEGTQKAKL